MRVEGREKEHTCIVLRNEPNILTSRKETQFEYFFAVELLIFARY